MIPDRIVAQVVSSPWFEARWSPYALLDAELRIRASNWAFSTATGTHPDHLRDGTAVDALPVTPDDPDAESTSAFLAAVEDVLRHRRAIWMGIHGHDLPHPYGHGAYVRNVWMPVDLPVTDRGRAVGVLHHVQDLMTALAGPVPMADPSHAPGMAAAVHRLRREFPRAPLEAVLGLLTDSHRTVLRVVGVPDTDRTVTLARLRLEVLTERPGQVQPDP